MLVAIETADRTPRPTFGFTRKLFSNMKLKWEGEEIPLTPPMLAIAAAGNDAADDDDATNEDNAAADEAAGSAAEAHPVPHSPPVSPVREQRTRRGMFGPEPRPAGYVDPDVLEPIIFGPQPRPSDFVDPDLEEPVIFGPPPRPDNYIEPADIDNLVSMEDDTIHGGFHEESPVGGPMMLLPKVELLVYGAYRLIGNRAGNLKENHGGSYFDTCISSKEVVKKERTVNRLKNKTPRFVGDAPPKRGLKYSGWMLTLERINTRKRSVYRRARTEFNTSAFAQFHAPLSADVLPQTAISESAGPSVAADKGKAPMPELDIPAEFLAEDAQARQRLEEEQASERLVQRLRAEDLAKEDLPNVSAERAKELDDLMMRMTETDWLNLMLQVGSNPALARELLGADVTEANFVERMTAIKKKKRACRLVIGALKAHNGTITMKAVKAMSKQQLIEEYEYICRRLEKDRLLSAHHRVFLAAKATNMGDDPDSAGGGSFKPAVSATPMAGFAVPDTAGGTLGTNVTASTVPTSAAMDSAGSHRESGVSPFADSADSSSPSPVCLSLLLEPDSDDEVLAENYPFRDSESESEDEIGELIIPLSIVHFKIGRWMNSRLHSDDVEDFWRTQDEWIVSSWKLYPKSSVHASHSTPILSGCVVAGNVYSGPFQAAYEKSYECLASKPMLPNLDGNSLYIFLLGIKMASRSKRLLATEFSNPGVLKSMTTSCTAKRLEVAVLLMLLLCFVAAWLPFSNPADYVSAGHVLVPADRDRIC
ncbi:hypothetical protein Tco_0823308 [Tanacetum coccineum]|uniref:Uncharacterized protein n=1 Tax=Tanacetum coccineum TaxID=301880 RepID=A0ABQ5AMH0_9ASTR